MTDKNKKSTSNQLIVRAGGFALSLPIALALASILLMVNFLLVVIILGGLMGLNNIITPYLGILSIILLSSVATMFVLLRSVLGYLGGINNLWKRLRGIQDEQARIDRLIDKETQHQNVDSQILNEAQSDSREQAHQGEI